MYYVIFTKEFTKGYLEGIKVETKVPFASLGAATAYLTWCKAHHTKPVKPCAGISKYIIHKPAIFDTL